MRFWFFLVPSAIAASCGGVISGADGGSDAGSDVTLPPTCATAGDCPSGFVCEFPVSDGCSAKQKCLPAPGAGACKAAMYCGCDGTTNVKVCGPGASTPVASPGICEGPQCGLACEICDTTGFSAVPQVKPNDATNACSAQDIASFVTACLSASATQQTCSAWEKTDAGTSGCFACMVTQSSSAAWGPLICDSSGCTLNTGGCIDIVSGQVVIENGTNGSCGDLTSAADQCVGYACAACTTPSDSDTCAQHAEQTECKSYFDKEQTASVCSLVDAGPSTCSPQNDADWASFLNVFCGTGP